MARFTFLNQTTLHTKKKKVSEKTNCGRIVQTYHIMVFLCQLIVPEIVLLQKEFYF